MAMCDLFIPVFCLSVRLVQTICGVGSFSTDRGCVPCNPGRYSGAVAATGCTPCPSRAPYSRIGATAAVQCSQCVTGCEGGTFGREAASASEPCPGGHACAISGLTHIMVRIGLGTGIGTHNSPL